MVSNSRAFIVFLLTTCHFFLIAQNGDIQLINPSFEGPAMNGASNNRLKTIGWSDCGFQKRTPHDIHQGLSRTSSAIGFFGVRQPASHGNTFLGMVVRDDDTYEGVSQRLSSPIQSGKCYSFHVDLSKSDSYISPMPKTEASKNYVTPVVLRIFGGATPCGKRELLAETSTVKNIDWERYEMEFRPQLTHRYITLVAFYKVPVLFPYNGNLLVDNASELIVIPCPNEDLAEADVEDELEVIIDEAVKEEESRQEEVKVSEPIETIAPETTVEEEPSPSEPTMTINSELDRSKIKEGQTIKINKLFFAADASDIDSKSTPALNELAEFLKYNDDIIVEIGGHTNRTPPDHYCDSLSTERAKSVADYLNQKGISEDQIKYKGYGKRKPIALEKSKQARARNQRVEIKVLRIGK